MSFEKFTWLEKKLKDPSILDVRKDARIIPASPHSTLILADGTTHGCFIIDMSVPGAAVSAEVQPPVGECPWPSELASAASSDFYPNGFAVKFVENQNRHDLNRLIARPIPLLSTGDARLRLLG